MENSRFYYYLAVGLLALCFISVIQSAMSKTPLNYRAKQVIVDQLGRVPPAHNYTKEQLKQFYADGKIVKLYDLDVYMYLTQAGITAKPVDYMHAVLHAHGWATIDADTIVYAYPIDQPPHKQ